MRKSDVTPVGLVMTKDGKTAFVTLGHAAHVAVVDVPTRKIAGYILVGKRSWGITLSRDEQHALSSPTASATTSRSSTCASRKADDLDPGRPHSLGRGHR